MEETQKALRSKGMSQLVSQGIAFDVEQLYSNTTTTGTSSHNQDARQLAEHSMLSLH